jgi:hypothetical protein
LNQHVFQYAPETVGSELIYRPKITVSLYSTNNNWHHFRVYVDSGADISLFTKDDAGILGLTLKEGKYKPIIGVGRTLIPAYIHTIKLKIGDTELNAKVAFADSDETSRLLGRTDIFPYFKITFNEQKLEITFQTLQE